MYQEPSNAVPLDLLRILFEQAPGFAALLTGPSHTYQMTNRAYIDLVGPRNLVGNTVAEALPELVEQGIVEMLDRVYQTGKSHLAEGFTVTLAREPNAPPVNRFLDFVLQPIKLHNGRVMGVFVQGVDVTERILAEEELRAEEATARQTLDALPLSIVLFDRFCIARMANQHACKTAGKKADELVGKHFVDLLGQNTFAARGPIIAAALRGETHEFEAPWTGPDGRQHIFCYKYFPRIHAEEVVGFYVTAIEIQTASTRH